MSNFHHTAEIHTIRVEDGRILRSRVAREDGEFVDSEIDLDRCVGNDNGRFVWGGENFAHSADEIRVDIEGDNQPILRARLRTEDGEMVNADLNLCERIMNRDGQLCFE